MTDDSDIDILIGSRHCLARYRPSWIFHEKERVHLYQGKIKREWAWWMMTLSLFLALWTWHQNDIFYGKFPKPPFVSKKFLAFHNHKEGWRKGKKYFYRCCSVFWHWRAKSWTIYSFVVKEKYRCKVKTWINRGNGEYWNSFHGGVFF